MSVVGCVMTKEVLVVDTKRGGDASPVAGSRSVCDSLVVDS